MEGTISPKSTNPNFAAEESRFKGRVGCTHRMLKGSQSQRIKTLNPLPFFFLFFYLSAKRIDFRIEGKIVPARELGFRGKGKSEELKG